MKSSRGPRHRGHLGKAPAGRGERELLGRRQHRGRAPPQGPSVPLPCSAAGPWRGGRRGAGLEDFQPSQNKGRAMPAHVLPSAPGAGGDTRFLPHEQSHFPSPTGPEKQRCGRVGNEETPHFGAARAATRNPLQPLKAGAWLVELGSWEMTWKSEEPWGAGLLPLHPAKPSGSRGCSRCRGFIHRERGNVPEPFDPIVCREAEWASRLSVTKQRL